MMNPEIRLKRIYDEPSPDDGFRILVDRLWPRGVSKASAEIDLWAKELTPSHGLRRWFHEDLSRLDEFAQRYRAELEEQSADVGHVLDAVREHPVITLVTATKDLVNGHAVVLKRFLDDTIRNCGT